MFPENNYQYGWPKGWDQLVCQLIENIVSISSNEIKVLQIKEKFGGLRFYYTTLRDGDLISCGKKEIKDLVDAAENKSYSVCQDCGLEGSQCSNQGWIFTLCEKCKFKDTRSSR